MLAGIAAGCGSILGVFLSPDLDVNHKTISERILLETVGILGWLFFVYWWPYAKLVRHRSWLSHAPLFGTALRLLYALGPLLYFEEYRDLLFTEFVGWMVVGLAVSDIAHWVMDW
jgi:uncharacterized metal-binding protein